MIFGSKQKIIDMLTFAEGKLDTAVKARDVYRSLYAEDQTDPDIKRNLEHWNSVVTAHKSMVTGLTKIVNGKTNE